jgi:predicted PurR-regulated permease PerM
MIESEPVPERNPAGERIRTACLVLITVCVVGAALQALGTILAPLLIAVFLFFLVKPAAAAVARWRVSPWISYPLLCLAFLAALLPLGVIVQWNAAVLEDRLPVYHERLVEIMDRGAHWVGGPEGEQRLNEGERRTLGKLFDGQEPIPLRLRDDAERRRDGPHGGLLPLLHLSGASKTA